MVGILPPVTPHIACLEPLLPQRGRLAFLDVACQPDVDQFAEVILAKVDGPGHRDIVLRLVADETRVELRVLLQQPVTLGGRGPIRIGTPVGDLGEEDRIGVGDEGLDLRLLEEAPRELERSTSRLADDQLARLIEIGIGVVVRIIAYDRGAVGIGERNGEENRLGPGDGGEEAAAAKVALAILDARDDGLPARIDIDELDLKGRGQVGREVARESEPLTSRGIAVGPRVVLGVAYTKLSPGLDLREQVVRGGGRVGGAQDRNERGAGGDCRKRFRKSNDHVCPPP